MKMPETLPRMLDYRRLALTNQTVAGCLGLGVLPRTREALDAETTPVIDVSLIFSEDEQRRVRLEGCASGGVTMTCQRCLEVFETTIRADIAGVIVGSDEAAASVPREDEPILAAGDVIDTRSLVDDELLLALPPVARCDRPACRAEYETDESAGQSSAGERETNPFAVLESLKNDKPSQR